MKNTLMLKKNYEFRKVLSKGKFFSGKFINAFIMENRKDYNLLGLAISVKTAKSVKRNRIKRLIRENYYFFENKIRKGKSIVFLWNKDALVQDINFLKIKTDMERIFDKADMFENRK